MTTEDKIGFIKFEGADADWHVWSLKTLALAKAKGFKQAYVKDTKPCSDAVYETSKDADEKKIYERNDKAYQLLVMSCNGMAFGLVNKAKTKDHMDGNAFLAWKNLSDRYAPNSASDLVQLSGEFNECSLDGSGADPDAWFIKLDLLNSRMTMINSAFEKQDMELIAHILNKLPNEYSEVVTSVEGITSLTLSDLQSKIRAFWKRKLKGEKNSKELALPIYTKFKGICRNCGKQGHKANDCRSKKATLNGDKSKTNNKDLKCFNCGKFAGHIAKDCPEPKKERNAKTETGMFVGVCIAIDQKNTEKNGNCESVIHQSEIQDSVEFKAFFVQNFTDKIEDVFTIEEFNANPIDVIEECYDVNTMTYDESWLADTGATSHITARDKCMSNVEEVNIKVIVGDGTEILCTKRGDLRLTNGKSKLLLQRVLYSPKIHKNIVSIGSLIRDGHQVKIEKNNMMVTDSSMRAISFTRENDSVLYYLKGRRCTYSDVAMSSYTIHDTGEKDKPTKCVVLDINTAHDIYGHIGEAALRSTLKAINVDVTGKLQTCEGCSLAKAKAKSVSKISTVKATEPGERLCVDISGPYKKSIIGSNYWILVVDQYSGKAWSFFVKKKSQLSPILDDHVTKLISAKFKLKYLRCDNAGENLSGLQQVCNKYGIQIEYTAPNTPQQNGIVERKFVTIRDRSCASMYTAKFGDEAQGLLWAESANTHTRLTNVVANSRNVKCPDWLWYGKQPTIYKHLVHFGRIGYVTIRTKQPKLEPKAMKCVMIGYSNDHSGDTYRMYNPETKKVLQSRDIKWADWHGVSKPTDGISGVFNPDGFGIEEIFEKDEETQVLPTLIPDNNTSVGHIDTSSTVSTAGRNTVPVSALKPATIKSSCELKNLGLNEPLELPIMHSTLSPTTSTLVEDEEDVPTAPTMEVHYIYSSSLASDPGEPKGYAAAMKGDERARWIPAIKSEIENFYKRNVWTKFPRSKLNGRKPLGNRWVFKKKHEQDHSTRYKGRIVVKGYVQIPGVDFTDSFAPVATDTSIRILFCLTLYYDKWVCEIIDVEASFLEADLDKSIYIEWPDGVVEFGFESEKETNQNCILLNKAMYGTVQAARQWFKKLIQCLTTIGMTQSRIDPCIFYLKRSGKTVLLVGTYVDDCAVAGRQKDVNWLKSEVKKFFTIKELGLLKKHLGVWYKWGNDGNGRFLLSSMEDFFRGMIDDFSDLFGRYPKHAETPGLPGTSLTKNDDDTLLHGEYRSMVGKILYFVKKVSPTCANACRELSQHLENPGPAHWKAVERLLGYLHEDPTRRTMKLRKPVELRVMDVVDSAFANNVDTRKSTSAYLGTIGGTALVNWISKGQNIVTLSSTESEYVSLSDGAKETTFAMNLIAEIAEVELPSYICEDNTGAIFLSKNEQVGA